MKNHLQNFLFIALMAVFFVSCSSEILQIEDQNSQQLLSIEEMHDLVLEQLHEGDVFYWTRTSDQVIWSAGMLSDSIYSIGYKPTYASNIDATIHAIDVRSFAWREALQAVESKILEAERKALNRPDLQIEDIKPMGDVTYFPQIAVRITDYNLISELRQMPQVRFVEPLGFSLEDLMAQQRSGSGCSGSPNYNINSNDYAVISPNTKSPWNFYTHDIDHAWNQAQGDDATICIIDTGASDSQDNLGSQFTSGDSGGRYIQKFSTHYSGSWWWRRLDSPHDPCGHGTSMSGLAAAPRGTDGNSVGVAYKSNLISVRAVADVVISSSNERAGVRDALYLAANRNDVDIVSMSIGTPFYSSTVADGIYYAYNNGLMLFAAAGTSLSWTSWVGVIFPANMSQTVAVTGVKDAANNQKCSNCHSGSAVDFVIVMQRANNNDRTSVALATSSNQPKYIGGSSAATATAAGIAALVWGENPNYTRSDIMNDLKSASQYYPGRNSQYGWGRINANAAVGGPPQ